MKYSLIFIFIFLSACTSEFTTLNLKEPYTSKGFAYIYNETDLKNKIIKNKMNSSDMQISHQNLRTGTLIKLINPKNNESIVLKNVKRIKYPEFYKVLITLPVAKKLDLNLELPILEIIEIKKNKSFVAKKAKIYNEEKKIPSKAPVANVQISNISKNKSKISNKNLDKIFIHIGTFYSKKTAFFLKDRLIKDLSNYNTNKIKVKNINNKKTQVISGPYTSVNSLKNDYIKLKNYGFEELDIFIND